VEKGHRIYRRCHTREAGDYLEPLANFTARITGEDVIDDGGGEPRHVFRVEGTLHSGARLPAAAVPSGEFAGMGWRVAEADSTRPPGWSARGRQVGWVDGEGAYLGPDAVYAEVQRLGDEQGERLPLTQAQLFKRVKGAGLLASWEKGKTTTRRTLQCRERAGLHLRLEGLGAGGTATG
jgi:hypothetical protein